MDSVFAIAIEQDQYKSYILTDQEHQSRLEIVPERGGIATKWRIQGQDILYLDEERFADPRASVRGGIPILFPICGNLPGDTYTRNGKSYQLKQHGFARDLPWEVRSRLTDDCAGIILALDSNARTRALYPFDFQLEFTYRLKGMTLAIEQRYTNRSKDIMPFSTGLHPYFWCADKTQLEFEIPATHVEGKGVPEGKSFNGTFDFDVDEIDVALRPVTGSTAIVRDRRRKLQIDISYSKIYSTLVFWTLKGKNYVCLEPWSAPRNALNTGENLTYLEPGQTCEARVELRVSYL
ncbi:aldose epimerase [Oscillatoria sp. FACHB-1406]|uniref:aldose epimerase family protein n=1 Tax=Oscillatoria sp. FACHB-1406 TaxID=2692846 RepID=UPI001682CF55|nr:aldose epimerase [Oscillatoria sp. FACHB-1406]MBD2577037.1 aldose epimerase [Oscillatoria sp. FACHB-1406]